MKSLKPYLYLVFFTSLVGFGAAIALKAAIGVGPWDAMAQSVSFITTIKVGTVGMLFNTCCVLLQLIIKGKDFELKTLFQIPMAVATGVLINFFYYNVFESLSINLYITKVIMVLIANIFTSLGVSAIMELGIVSFPLEGFCHTVADKYGLVFSKFRQFIDIIVVAIVFALTFLFNVEMTIREGTVVSLLLFGPLLGIFMPKLKTLFERTL